MSNLTLKQFIEALQKQVQENPELGDRLVYLPEQKEEYTPAQAGIHSVLTHNNYLGSYYLEPWYEVDEYPLVNYTPVIILR